MPKPKGGRFDITAKNKTKAAFSKVSKRLGAMKLAGAAEAGIREDANRIAAV